MIPILGLLFVYLVWKCVNSHTLALPISHIICYNSIPIEGCIVSLPFGV